MEKAKYAYFEYDKFEAMMNRYKEENESIILKFARDLYMLVTFLGVAFLVTTVIL